MLPAATQVTQRSPVTARSGIVNATWQIRLQRHWNDTPVRGRGGALPSRREPLLASQGGLLVDVGHGRLGELLAQPGDEVGSGQAPAAHVEEVVGEVRHDCPEDLQPELLEPGRRAAQLQRLGTGGSERGYRPRQCVAVDLPEVRVGRVSTSASRGTRGGQSVAQRRDRLLEAKPSPATYPTSRVLPRPGAADRGRCPVTPGREQGAVDLAELDSSTSTFTWSSALLEDQPTSS